MKKLIPFLIILAIAAMTIVSYKGSKDFQRKKYEAGLKSRFGTYFGSKEIKGNKAVDQPDMAAIQDYYMTLDPSTGTVPRERLLQVFEQERQNAHMKSVSADAPQWTGTPVEMGGRTRAMMYDPNFTDKVWAGGVTGGLWYNNDVTDPFSSWVPVGDFWSCLAIRCITFDPNNHNTFYLGTGEPETAIQTYRESSGLGNGIWKSTDGGQTWNPLSSTNGFAYITKMIVKNEGGNSVIYAGVVSGIYHGIHTSLPSDGLFRSADGGATWTQVLPDIPSTSTPYSPSDVVLGADGRIYVGTMPNLEEQGAATILFSDAGLPGSWTVNDSYRAIIAANPEYPIPGRVVFGITPADPNRVYALIAQGFINSENNFKYFYCFHIAKSTDKGATWTDTNLPTELPYNISFASIGWHALDIAVDPNDADNVFIGGLDLYKTMNGGNSWSWISDWALMYSGGGQRYVHADQHIALYKPGSSTEMVFGCDGGVFYTADATDIQPTFEERNLDYNTLQFYTGAIENSPGSEVIMGGLQDNGTEMYTGNQPMGIYTMISGGDGAYCFFDKDEPGTYMSSYYYNRWEVWQNDSYWGYIGDYESGIFVNPTDYDNENNTIYANACDFINYRLDYYSRITDITGNVIGTFKKANTNSSTYFSAVKLSPFSALNNRTIYLGTQSGQLFKVTGASGNTPVSSEITGSEFPVGNISCIETGATENELIVTFSNYGVASVWHTTDGGTTWKNKESSLPDMPVRWAIFNPDNKKYVMLATESGIYFTSNFNEDNPTWEKSTDGMPNVRVDQLRIREIDNTVLASTHGRGLFTSVWDVISGTGNINSASFSIYPLPATDKVNIRFSSARPQQVTYRLYDQSGKEVMTISKSVASGNNDESLNISNLPAGIYYIGLYSGSSKSASGKIIKL